MSNVKKITLVVVGALLLSVLGIQASDTLRGLNTGLSGLVSDATGPCAVGEIQFLLGSHALCVDQYEASPGEDCRYQDVAGQTDTQANLNQSDCWAATKAEALPWRFVSMTQAQQLCARTGKRLPTSDEWYRFSSGITEVSSCVLDANGPSETGESECATPAGVYDAIGNVWEWVDGQVVDGRYGSRSLPESGYVSLVDASGVVLETSVTPVDEFDSDYAWTRDVGVFGIIRGGFYGSESDGGIFAQNLSVPLDFKTAGVGFRCVRDI